MSCVMRKGAGIYYLFLVLFLIFSGNSVAHTLNIAVASSFSQTMKELAKSYTNQTKNKVRISNASSGKLYSQILNGAPFDLYFSADTERPSSLIKKEIAEVDSYFVYARGVLTFWSKKYFKTKNLREIVKSLDLKYLAIANPIHAPYGKASKEVLVNLDLWKSLKNKIIFGENITQASQFAFTGNSDSAFLSLSQIKGANFRYKNFEQFLIIPQSLYSPLKHAVVLLKSSKKRDLATSFLSYIKSRDGKKIMERYGYK